MCGDVADCRYRYIKEFPSGQFSGAEKSNKAYEELLEKYEKDYEPEYESEFEEQCKVIYKVSERMSSVQSR